MIIPTARNLQTSLKFLQRPYGFLRGPNSGWTLVLIYVSL